MLNLFKKLPIYRRLFLAFLLAVLIPDIVILLIGSIFIQALSNHGVNSAQTSPLLLATFVALLFSTAVVVVLGFIVNMTITQPLRQLVDLTKRIRQGDASARVPVSGRDEIAMVALSMNSMLDNIVQLIQQAEQGRDQIQARVEKLVGEVSGVGEGDLRIQAEVTSDALGVLADSFNYMAAALSNLVVRVKTIAQEVGRSATSTEEQMVELVRVADTQLQRMAVATQQVEQMSQSSQRAAERVKVLDEAASAARLTAQSGRRTVQRTVEGMGRINKNVQETARRVLVLKDRSSEINEIVEVIQNIAHLTNRLALDASIQAAMAGENGKGFRAIANDIRHLAENAKMQAGMIAQIVRGVNEEVKATSESMQETVKETLEDAALVQESGIAFEKIYTVVEQQAQEIEAIKQVVLTLSQSSSSVAEIVRGVSISTQQSTVRTREMANTMKKLSYRGEQLLSSVEAFKLRDDAFDAMEQAYTQQQTYEQNYGTGPLRPVKNERW
jgi:methyl-accepting chemotaxis protein